MDSEIFKMGAHVGSSAPLAAERFENLGDSQLSSESVEGRPSLLSSAKLQPDPPPIDVVRLSDDRETGKPSLGGEKPRRVPRKHFLAVLAAAMGFACMAMAEALAKGVAEAVTQYALEHHADRTLGAMLVVAVLAALAAIAWRVVARYGREEQGYLRRAPRADPGRRARHRSMRHRATGWSARAVAERTGRRRDAERTASAAARWPARLEAGQGCKPSDGWSGRPPLGEVEGH
jgi:hypothetical protein